MTNLAEFLRTGIGWKAEQCFGNRQKVTETQQPQQQELDHLLEDFEQLKTNINARFSQLQDLLQELILVAQNSNTTQETEKIAGGRNPGSGGIGGITMQNSKTFGPTALWQQASQNQKQMIKKTSEK